MGLEEVPDKRPKNFSDKIEKSEKMEKKEKLLLFFKGKKIYIEIFNGKENASDVFLEILLEYKIVQCKRLCKNIDYIIFKEGHLKTKKYAVMNNIKMVNPLWVDDKINRNIFKDDKEYLVENNMGDILLQEKLEKNKKDEKDYENELEAEFDVEYANMIDKQRENEIKKSEEKNTKKHKNIGNSINREKKKANKNKTEIIFLENEPEKKNKNNNNNSKNMVIEDFLETNHSSHNLTNYENKTENIYDTNNTNISNDIIIKEKVNVGYNLDNFKKKNNPFVIEKINKKEKINKLNNIKYRSKSRGNALIHNKINKTSNNKNLEKAKSKTPDKTKKLKKSKLKSKDYKHVATSKKIMVTNVSEMVLENNNSTDHKIIQDIIQADNNPLSHIKKENQNLNSNYAFTPDNKKIAKNMSDIKSKDKSPTKVNSKKEMSEKKSTLGQKINIITYKLEEKEIQCLKTMPKFEYKGDLKNLSNDYGELYGSASVIILDKEKSKYDWKMYEFFFDKKILVDFASFLFEFMTEQINEDLIDAQRTLNKLNKISINEETYFFNKKIRYQRRSLMHSYNIVENISDKKKEKDEKNEKSFNFVLNKSIIGGEKWILHKILKKYLKANVFKVDFPAKRSQSMAPGFKFKFTTEEIMASINEKRGKIFLIQKICRNRDNDAECDKMDIIDENEEKEEGKEESNKEKEDKEEKDEKEKKEGKEEDDNDENSGSGNKQEEEDEDDATNEEKNEMKDVEGDTYLISKEKNVTKSIIKYIPNFKEVISYKYVFDSFSAGELKNLNDEKILKKYLFE